MKYTKVFGTTQRNGDFPRENVRGRGVFPKQIPLFVFFVYFVV